MPLTPRQQRVVEAPLDRCVVVNAGPGTGKTHVLVERFLHLIERGLEIPDVLVVTFGREAARELKERIARRLLDAGLLTTTLQLERAWISNFHGLCFRLLREHGLLASFDPTTRILDQVEAIDVALQARRRFLGSSVVNRAVAAETQGNPLLAGVLDRLSYRFDHAVRALGRAKENLLDAEEALAAARRVLAELGDSPEVEGERRLHAALEECLPAIAAEYESLKTGGGQVDFVDLQVRAVRFLESEAGRRFRGRFKAILVDELQDTNLVQLRLLELLAGDRLEAVMGVGDERQAIYAFRGARVDNIRRLPERVADHGGPSEVLDLIESHRSYQEILDLARGVLPASTTLAQGLEAVALGRAVDDRRAPRPVVRAFKAETKVSEAEWIAEQIMRHRGREVTAVLHDGTKVPLQLGWGHFAVLLRGVKSAREYEDALRARQIPYRTIGGTGFYDRREVLDLLAYLKAIANPYDGLALVRILQNLPFGLSDRSLRLLANVALHGATDAGVETDAHENKVVPGFRLKPYDAIRKALDDPGFAASVGLDSPALERLDRLWAFLARGISRRGAVPVTRLLQDVLNETGYGKLLLADESSGPLEALRRRKNVERLMRLARRHEERHIYGSLDELVRYMDRALDEEIQEEEEAIEADDRVVNVMTVHQAKGLEWPVVFVAGLTDRSWPMRGFPDEVPFFDDGGIVLRTEVIGEEEGGKLRYAETQLHARLAANAAGSREEEERRLLFVAMTRAKNLLHLSGYGKGTRYLDELTAALPEPGVAAEAEEVAPTPAPEVATAADATLVVDPRELSATLRRVLDPPAPEPVLASAAPKQRHVHLSFTQVDMFATCPLRYKFTYVVPLPGARGGRLPSGRDEGSAPAELAPAELGAIFHEALERWARDERSLDELVAIVVREHGWQELAPADAQRARRFADNFLQSRLGKTRPAPDCVEVPFSLRLEREDLAITVNGAIDRLDRDPDGGTWSITDYKTNRGVEPERYGLQLSIYRLAVERVLGRTVSGCFAYFIRYPEAAGLVEVQTLSAAETEARLFAVAARLAARDFALAGSPNRDTCWRCPFGGRDGPCPSRHV